MADAFISYKSEDRSWAELLSNFLTRNGHAAWWDRELLAGENYSLRIGSELRAAHSVVVIWSMKAAESEYVLAEAHYGRTHKKLVCSTIESMELPVPFNICNHSDLRKLDDARHRESLLESIRTKLPKHQIVIGEPDSGKPFVVFPINFHDKPQDTVLIEMIRAEIDSRNIPVFVRSPVPFGHIGVDYGSPTQEYQHLRDLCRKAIPVFVYLGWPTDEDSGYVWDIVIRNLTEIVPEVDPVQLFVGDTFAPRLSYKFGTQGEYFELGGISRRKALRVDLLPNRPVDQKDFVKKIVDDLVHKS